jgi:hypothetical protein
MRTKKGWHGIWIGLIPHIGCIAFIIGSIFGVTFLITAFKPILMSRFLFHFLIAISFFFATISAIYYLRTKHLLSKNGVIKKWRYLTILYGSTIFVNLFLFLLVFPLLTNASQGELGDNLLVLKVDIPCSGHAPLISYEIKTLPGVKTVKYGMFNTFDITYSSETSKEDILSLKVFETYPAVFIREETSFPEGNSLIETDACETTCII